VFRAARIARCREQKCGSLLVMRGHKFRVGSALCRGVRRDRYWLLTLMSRDDVQRVELKLRVGLTSVVACPADDIDRVGFEIDHWRTEDAPELVDIEELGALQKGWSQIHGRRPDRLTGVGIEGPYVVRHRADVHDIARCLTVDLDAGNKQRLRLNTGIVSHIEAEALDEHIAPDQCRCKNVLLRVRPGASVVIGAGCYCQRHLRRLHRWCRDTCRSCG